MKTLLITLIFLLSCSTWANDPAKFAEQKKMMLERISQGITIMQNNKTCVEAAMDPDAIKKCHETAKAERNKMETEKINKRIKQMEDQKKKLKN